jgi:hypothetical protein
MIFLTFLFSLGLSSLGLFIYFIWKAKRYIMTGRFNFAIWREENLHKFIYSFILLSFMMLLLTISPASKDILFNLLGVNFNVDGFNHENSAPELLGALVGAFVYSLDSDIRKEKETLSE